MIKTVASFMTGVMIIAFFLAFISQARSQTKLVGVGTLVMDENENLLGLPFTKDVRLYPNPAIGVISLKGLNGEKYIGLEVLSTAGKNVLVYPISENNKYDLSTLARGNYFCGFEAY